MQATLTFNLPEEQPEFNYAINGFKYHDALFDLRNQFRSWNKGAKEPDFYEIMGYFNGLLERINFE